MGKLTTHVLDTAGGKPGNNISVELYRIGATRKLIKRSLTNSDGRTNEAMLEGESFETGVWELVFDVGNYYRNFRDGPTDKPAFLEEVVIRFSLTADEHFHVPLLVSPFGYSTYRGS